MAQIATADLESAVKPHTRILLDSSVIIAYVEARDPFNARAARIVDDFVFPGRNPAIVSALTVMEVLIRPMRSGAPGGHLHTMDFFQQFPNLSVLPFDAAVAQEAASVRAHFRLDLPDAIIVASAIVGQVRYAVTADRAWVKKLEKVRNRVEVICLA